MKRLQEVKVSFLWLLVLFCGTLMLPEVARANDITDSSKTIAFGQTYTTSNKDNTYYRIEVPSSGEVTINATSTNLPFAYFRLFNKNGEYMTDEGEEFNDVTGQLSYSITYYLSPGIYYVGVIQGSGKEVYSHTITFGFEASNESFIGEHYNIPTANQLVIGNTYKGFLTLTDTVDFYKVDLDSAGEIHVSLKGSDGASYRFTVYQSNGTSLGSESASKDKITKLTEYNAYLNLRKGTYYFAIEKNLKFGGNYTLTTSFTSAGESFVDTGADDTVSGANSIILGQNYKGQASVVDSDYYRFDALEDKTYIVSISGNFETKCNIYDTNGKYEWGDYASKNEATGMYQINKEITLKGGTHYFCVAAYKYSGNYNFSISEKNKKGVTKLSKVKLKKVKSSKKRKILIQWKYVSGAAAYQVEVKRVGKKRKWVAYTKSNMVAPSGLARRKKYSVRVRAYAIDGSGNTIYGAWSKKRIVKIK